MGGGGGEEGMFSGHKKKVARFYLNMIRPRHKQPPRIYGLPQIHKANIPLRPIVSCVNTFAYALSAFLANILSPLRATQISRWLTQLTSHTSSAVRRFSGTLRTGSRGKNRKKSKKKVIKPAPPHREVSIVLTDSRLKELSLTDVVVMATDDVTRPGTFKNSPIWKPWQPY